MERAHKIGLIAAGIGIASIGIAARQQQSPAVTDNGTATSAVDVGGAPGLRTVEVIDPLFKQVAFRMSIPTDWVFDATVLRPHLGPALVFRASTPDGLTGLHLLPRYDWVNTPDPGMRRFYQEQKVTIMPPMRAEEFLRKYVLAEARPGVTVVGVEEMPNRSKAAEADQKQNAQFEAEARGSRPKHQTTHRARIRIAYVFNGHPVEEMLVAWVTAYDLPDSHGVTQLTQALVTGARAPRGRLDGLTNQLVAMSQSVVADQAWTAHQNQFALQNAQAQQRAIIANGQQRLAQNQAIFDASMQRTAAMEAARHQGAVATADHMGDVQAMVNPATGQTGKVSNQYNYSYVDQDGNVVHTNSATYNPNAQLRGNWTQLQPLKP